MFRMRERDWRDDRGVAIVAAVSVAFVAILLMVMIVAITIYALNASGRERARTGEIHSAEGAIDATMAAMENDIVCGVTDFTFGEGTQETTVAVDIVYYEDDFATVVTCNSSGFAGTPAYATVTATSTLVTEQASTASTRVLEARLAVTPRGGSVKLPGIYSAQDMYMIGTPDVFSDVDDGSPDIWVDGGDFYCEPTTNRQLEIEADLVVATGGASLRTWCWLTRNVFIEDDVTWSSSNPRGTQVNYRCNSNFICGDFTVRSGDLSLNTTLTAGSNVTVGGSISSLYRLDAQGNVSQNVGAANIEEKPYRGFPSVQFVYENWQNAYGMDLGDYDDFVDRINFERGYNRNSVSGCNFNSRYFRNTIALPSDQPMVYDLRDCDVMRFSGTVNLQINADTAFIVNGFHNSGNLMVYSGDGEEHQVWFIVPDEGVPAYSDSSINKNSTCSHPTKYWLCSTQRMESTSDVAIMWYTKHVAYFNNNDNDENDMYGQVFAGSVFFRGYLDLRFETTTIPGEILWQAGDPGVDVQLLSKEEMPSS